MCGERLAGPTAPPVSPISEEPRHNFTLGLYYMNDNFYFILIPLPTDKDVQSYLVNAMHLEVGDTYYSHYPDKTLLTVELHGKLTLKQLRQIERQTLTILDSIILQYDELAGSSHVDVLFLRV